MSFSVPCPSCQTAVPLSDRSTSGGAYVECPNCRGTFLLIDEEALPDGDVVEFVPSGGTESTLSDATGTLSLPQRDDSLRSLATGSLFLGGVSISFLCIPALSILCSVCGIVLGVVSLNTSESRRALMGLLLNGAALLFGISLFLEALKLLLEKAGA